MLIGISGVHGTGKTTLARLAAEELNGAFVPTSTSDVFRKMGFDPAKPMSFEDRLAVQEEVLKVLSLQWGEAAGQIAFTDRTPFDLIAYTLADVDSYADVSDQVSYQVDGYISRCVRAYREHFHQVAITPNVLLAAPGETEKLRANLASPYRAKFHRLLLGSMIAADVEPAKLTSIDLHDRVEALRQLLIIY